MFLILLLPALLLLALPLLKLRFGDHLNKVGIQVGEEIWTPLTKIYYPSAGFDLVLLAKHDEMITGFRLFHSEFFTIPFHHPPVGHRLLHVDGDEAKEYPYMPGTPSRIRRGSYVLYQQQKRGLGVRLKEIAMSGEWPMVLSPESNSSPSD